MTQSLSRTQQASFEHRHFRSVREKRGSRSRLQELNKLASVEPLDIAIKLGCDRACNPPARVLDLVFHREPVAPPRVAPIVFGYELRLASLRSLISVAANCQRQSVFSTSKPPGVRDGFGIRLGVP